MHFQRTLSMNYCEDFKNNSNVYNRKNMLVHIANSLNRQPNTNSKF